MNFTITRLKTFVMLEGVFGRDFDGIISGVSLNPDRGRFYHSNLQQISRVLHHLDLISFGLKKFSS